MVGEGGREWWCWASRFHSGAVVRVRGRSFSFIAGVVVSWAFVISEWGVVVVRWGPSLSLGVVVVGAVVVRGAGRCRLGARSLFVGLGCRYSWGWAVVCGCRVVVGGCWVSLRGARLSFGGGRRRSWAPHCCYWVACCRL